MPFDNKKNEQEQVSIPIMPNIMIDEIILSPFLTKSFSEWIIKAFQDHSIPVKESKIKLK